MGDWQTKGTAQQFSMVGNDILSRPKPVYPSLTANTKGLWVELGTADIDASAITVMIPEGYGGTDYLVDIGIGPAGSEQVLVANLNISIGSTSYGDKVSFCSRIPIPVRTGTRIAARVQGTTTSASRYIRVGVLLEANGQSAGGRVVTIGASTADSGGVAIDPGAVDNTKGAWVEIVAACPANLRAAIIGFGTSANTAMTNCLWLVDIGIGGAGVEQVLIPNIALAAHDYPDALVPAHTPCFEISIPAGVRIAARAACTIVDATDRKFDVFIYGIA
jgi:hypothetical protein